MSATLPEHLAIRADAVAKSFRLPREQVHTLKELAVHPLRRRSFDRLHALRDVSFDVARGESFGIVGRNGSGKSTLMKCLAGIYELDGGSIGIDGRLSPFIELGVGFNPDLAARDNVILNATMLGLSRAEARERFEQVIRFAELEEFEDLKLKNYSSGMHVRLAFSVMSQVDADIRWSGTTKAKKALADNGWYMTQAVMYHGAAAAQYARALYLRSSGQP